VSSTFEQVTALSNDLNLSFDYVRREIYNLHMRGENKGSLENFNPFLTDEQKALLKKKAYNRKLAYNLTKKAFSK
jgi:hypothetical protein